MSKKSLDFAVPSGDDINWSNPLVFLMSLSKRGDIVPYENSYGPTYLINHPDHIRQVLHSGNYVKGSLMKMSFGEGLLASEGSYWRHQRRAMQPLFHQQSIAAFDSIITDTTIRTLQRWQTYEGSAQSIDVAAEMTCLTLGIISKALFGADLGDSIGQFSKAIASLNEDLGYFGRTLFKSRHHITRSGKREFDEALQTIDRFAYDIIKSHRRENLTAPLLSMLLHGGGDDNEELNDRQLRDEVVTMLLAGHISPTNMLVWTCYLLSEHPEVEEQLYAEVTQVLGGRLPTARDASKLQRTRMILEESLRLYPPVWFFARKALADDEIGGCRISANAAVVISPYTMHRHPGFWEKPEQFDPARFTEDLSQSRARYAYLPFGGGPHLCIGNHLAMLEGQLVLATIAQSYRLRLLPGQSAEPDAMFTLKAPSGLKMRLEARPELPRHA